MESMLLDGAYRLKLIGEIKNYENEKRSQESLRDCDIYKGEIRPYVVNYLESRFSKNTVNEMAVISSINLTKKLVDQKGSLYRNPPKRDFVNASDTQEAALDLIYKDMSANYKLMASNRLYELQRQTHCLCIPKNGKLILRPIKQHQINVVPYMDDPEKGEIFIFSSFDKDMSRIKDQDSDNIDQSIADEDDYKTASERYIVWSPSYHFVMNGHGIILSEDITNPIAPIVPVVEIASDKDFEYFIRGGSEVSNFTVEYNGALSSLGHIVDMQGFAQAYLKAPATLQPSSVQIGPNYILRLTTDPNGDADVDFGFAQSGADLAGAQSYVESLLAQFLSSQGVDPKTVSGKADGQAGFSSGVERLLSLVEKFESSKDVQSLYTKAEKEIFSIVKAWHNVLKNTDQLDDKYKAEEISDDVELSVMFEKPENIQTEDEVLAVIEKKIDLGLISRIDAIMQLEGISREDAIARAEEIDAEEFKVRSTEFVND